MDHGDLNGVAKAEPIMIQAKKSGTFSERHQEGCENVGALEFRKEDADCSVRVFSRLLSGAVGHIKRHRGQGYRSGDGNPRRECATVPLRALDQPAS